MSPPSVAISQATNFLNEVFPQRAGHEGCPYEYQFQSVIRQHLLDLVGVSCGQSSPVAVERVELYG